MILKPEQLPRVALKEMNEIHLEEVDMINKIYETAQNGNFDETKKLFDEFVEHIEEHFAFEEDMMEQNEFFAYPMHKAEHDRVLSDIYRVKEKFEQTKDTKVISGFIQNGFIPWLINHLNTMDMVTADFLAVSY